MQEEEDIRKQMKEMFAKACRCPCLLVALVLEMEHRANGETYEELIRIQQEVLPEMLKTAGGLSKQVLSEEAVRLEIYAQMHELSIKDLKTLLESGIDAMVGDSLEKEDEVKTNVM